MKLAVAFTLPFLGLLSCATTSHRSLASATDIPTCKSINIRQAKIGTVCLTAGAQLPSVFRLIDRSEDGKETWKDTRTGIAWADKLDNTLTLNAAQAACKQYSAGPNGVFSLPTKSHFEKSRRDGFSQVLPNLKDTYFWTSTSVENDMRYTYDYYGGSRIVAEEGSINDTLASLPISARCVSISNVEPDLQPDLPPQPAYTDPSNNVRWLAELPETYTHGCFEGGSPGGIRCTLSRTRENLFEAVEEDSDAAKACRDIGARLPTQGEIISLLRNFDHEEQRVNQYVTSPVLTEKGFKEMEAKLGDMKHSYWSSSVINQDTGQNGYVLNRTRLDVTYRYERQSVRCVLSK